MQTTLKSSVSFVGKGLHSGKDATVTVHPASAEHGIWFRRIDIADTDAMIPARWDSVIQSPLCTRVANSAGVEVSTVEHLMAAMAGCGIHNALIDIDGPEVPILDGSAVPFVRGILAKGLQTLNAPIRAIKVLKPVEARRGDAIARLTPADNLTMSFHINFDDAAIGVQDKSLNLRNGAFVRELSDSRTFCRQSDVDLMRANGLALGGTMNNAVVVDGDNVLSPGGLRHRDEAVRHKMLDALGDLAMAGAPLLAHYEGYRAGHSLTNELLRVLFSDPAHYELITCDSVIQSQLPGVGVHAGEIPAVA